MKKIKKWHIILVIILVISGLWLSQNMWVFENRVSQNEYFNNINNSKWIENEGREWSFNNTNLKIWTPSDSTHSVYTGSWKLENEKIEFNGNALDNEREIYFKQKIYFMSNDTLILDPYLPAKGERHTLKKIR